MWVGYNALDVKSILKTKIQKFHVVLLEKLHLQLIYIKLY